MRRTAFITLACTLTALAGSAAPAPAQKPVGKASVRVSVCRSDVKGIKRKFTPVGSMSTLRVGNRMEMRFELYVMTPTAPTWTRVDGPGLGIWNRAKAGTTDYEFIQRTVNLTAPATYKARVTFRWVGPGKERTVRRLESKPCEQTDPRPNLRIARLDATPIKGGMANYQVVIRNAGLTEVTEDEGFGVVVSVDGVAQPSRDVASLRPGELVQVNVRGPRCAQGGSIRATVDPDQRVNQSDRADDVLELPCPASLAPSS